MSIENARFRLTRRLVTARWLTEGEGRLVGYSLDIMLDAFVQRVRLGLVARFPGLAPDDALGALGRDRRVTRGINETVASYVQRLLVWIEDRQVAGNPYALLQKLAEYTGPGFRFRTVDARGNWFTRNADGSFEVFLDTQNWDWDSHNAAQTAQHHGGGTAARWSRFWVICYPPEGFWAPAPLLGAGPRLGSSSGTLGSTAPREHVQTIRAIVCDWKPAGTRCVNIIVAFDPTSFDPTSDPLLAPDGWFGRWSKNVGGVQVPSRLATARYWDGSGNR